MSPTALPQGLSLGSICLGFWRIWLALSLTTLLAACATPMRSLTPGEDIWSGRLALRVDSPQPQAFSAAFELRGTPETGELHLNSPLGSTLARVAWTPLGAELREGERVTRYATLDELTTELSGTALPVAALFGWLKGQPVVAEGWRPDLSLQAEGKVTAQRLNPEPKAELRIIFQP